jgi:hypothetical protein
MMVVVQEYDAVHDCSGGVVVVLDLSRVDAISTKRPAVVGVEPSPQKLTPTFVRKDPTAALVRVVASVDPDKHRHPNCPLRQATERFDAGLTAFGDQVEDSAVMSLDVAPLCITQNVVQYRATSASGALPVTAADSPADQATTRSRCRVS